MIEVSVEAPGIVDEDAATAVEVQEEDTVATRAMPRATVATYKAILGKQTDVTGM